MEPGGQDDQGATVDDVDVSVTANNGSGSDGAAAVAEAGGGGGGGSCELHMSFTVRFSVAHRKHEAMESAGLFKGAWPSVAFPPHRSVSSWLRERVLGRKAPPIEEAKFWHQRAEELRTYFERVFRLPEVRRQAPDLAELVRWI